jgi:hypothetical protein
MAAKKYGKSLKELNQPILMAFAALNFLVLYLAITTGEFSVAALKAALAEWRSAIPAAIGVVLTTVLNGLVPADWKYRLVFHRWNDALPGCRAFSVHAKSDPRIDLGRLRERHGRMPSTPTAQNALWYSIYRGIQDEPAVRQGHRDFLLTRDCAALAALFIPVLGLIGLLQIPTTGTAVVYFILLVVQFALVRLAASHYGTRMVTTVLAVEGNP